MKVQVGATLLLLCFLSIFCHTLVTAQDLPSSKTSFTLKPTDDFPFTVINDETSQLNFTYSFTEYNHSNSNGTLIPSKGWIITVTSNNKIIHLKGPHTFTIDPNHPNGHLLVRVAGHLPGRTTLRFTVEAKDNNVSYIGDAIFNVLSERKDRPIDIAFNVVIILMVSLANVGMGAKVDLDVVKSELKRPIGPVVAMISQFLFMPLIAFAIAYNIDLDPGIALGLFALGCSPGGSASNAYTYLLEGNVSLSVTMTLLSTVAAFGMLPLWLFTLGRVIYQDSDIDIPFENIFFTMAGVVIPVGIGLILQKKCPKAAAFMIKAVKYIILGFILFMLTVGVYANQYIFLLLSGEVLLASALLPYLGFLFGALAAWAARRDKASIIAIAVETGIQNTGIPIVLLRHSLTGPDKDTGIVAPAASALFTPFPLVIGIFYMQIKGCLKKRREAKEAKENEGGFVYRQSDDSEDFNEAGSSFIVRNQNL